MADRNLTDQLSTLLKDNATPQSVVNEVLASMAIVTANDMSELIEASHRQEQKLDELVRSINDLTAQIKAVDDIPERVTAIENKYLNYPSLVWLLRFRTKNTVTIIVLVFVALSLWFVSGARQPILSALGLPIF